MHRRQLLKFAAACAPVLPAPALAAPARLTPIKFTLDFRVTGQVAPFFVALAKGYYREQGLDVSIDVGSGSVASITRVASGAYDLGFGDISSLIEFNADAGRADLVRAVYQYYNRAPFVIIGRRDRGLANDWRSIAGKRIAAAAVESTRRAWPMAAKQLGMKADAFEWVTTDFSQRDNVLIRGDVDGATYFHDSAVSLFQRVPAEQLAVLKYSDAGLQLYGNAILASTKLAAANPNAVAGFLRATQRGLHDTLADPAGAMAHVLAREPLLNAATEVARWNITAGYVSGADTRQHGLGGVHRALVEQQIASVGETFGLKAKPALDGVYDLRFLPPMAERAPKA
ncbi:ABC transporter substrate-binding protein [Roseateles asaccharophilus]|uniref:ABC-type nitrate/sulfonate/bicarbonate transport system substrate-binding protein n=1 Tax=Roseateles asaccharophilus TaxID=582607 RepID=A0ABU2A8J6_9BURK|nr:ABC transporter substrate-binding protein [Roseateles asaccharophilus]MDR7333525.1 ABC-type nitrate/sulfonate/bicarbonate transport system substrate-binding protein [Roseateles asaccharophilus]